MRLTLRALLVSIGSWLIANVLSMPYAQARPASAFTPSSKLPAQVRAKLQRAHIPLSAVSVLVTRLDQATPIVALNAKKSMSPASTMKLVTTYAGLSMLGDQFRWRTSAYTDGVIEDGILRGNLYIRGTGDPKLVPETLIQFVDQIHQAGIRSIEGDLVLDKGYFSPSTRHLSRFDRTPRAPYNVGPDPLLYAFKSLIFTLTPQIGQQNQQVEINVKPALAQLQIINTLQASQKPCDALARAHAQALPTFTQQANGVMHAVFTGSYPLRCGIHDIAVATLDHTSFFSGGFLALWQQTGSTFKGRVREAPVPKLARLITVYKGLPLTDIVHDINKFSNNTMARNLFLTIGATHGKTPATTVNAARTVKSWLQKSGLQMPELILENGSGLSRQERISAYSMARLLRQANTSKVAQAFMTSLPIVGVDGTMRERLTYRPIAGNARIKTGTLDKVRAIAGYVVAKNGRTYTVVSFINSPRAQDGQAAHDALLEWVYQQAI